jgi:hypothetical protein
MRKMGVVVSLLALLFTAGCHYYTGIAKIGNYIYLTGGTNYFGFGSPWVKRCSELDGQLVCEKVEVNHDSAGSSVAAAAISAEESAASEAEIRAVLNQNRDAILSCGDKKFVIVKATVMLDRTLSLHLTGDLAGTGQEKCLQTVIGTVPLKTAKPGVVLIHNLP